MERNNHGLRFFIAFAMCMSYLAAWSQTPPTCTVNFPYSEGFNAATVNSCWSQLQISGAAPITGVANSQGPTIQGPYEGTHMLRFRSNFYAAGAQTRLMSSSFNTTGKSAITLKFQWWFTNEGSFSTYNDRVQVQYSTDGTTWTSTGSEIRAYDASTNGWSEKTMVLPAAVENKTNLYIGFLFTSGGGANCYLDNLTLNASAATTVCSGTPAPGNTLSTIAIPCPGENFTLSLQNAISGVTYQWQSSPDNNTWTNISSATAETLTRTHNASTYYRCIVTCSGNSGASNSLQVGFGGPVYTTLPVNESFESWLSLCGTSNVPANYWLNSPVTGNNSWRRNDQGSTAAWGSSTSGSYSPAASAGSYSARFHTYNVPSSTKGTLDLYVNCTAGGTQKELTFNYINTSGADKLNILLSTDGGVTFANISGAEFVNVTTWTLKTVSFSSSSATTVIRFQATSDYGTTDLGIDDVKLSAVALCSSVSFPASVNTQASKTSICSEESINFSLSAAMPNAAGITYQWRTSANNVTYINSGTATTSAMATITANANAKWIKCDILCNGVPVLTSNPVEITLQVQILTTTPGSRCGMGTVNLQATAASGNALNWYAVSTGGSSLGTGGSFTTPSISNATTYYVGASGASSEVHIGPLTPQSVSTSYGSTNNGDGIIFNATAAFQLSSVTIYPVDAAVDNVIYLKDASNNILQQLTFTTVGVSPLSSTSSVGSPYVINLNWNVPAGTGLRLVWGVPDFYGANRVLRNTSGAASQYNVANAGITFTGNTGSGTSYWYNFYDWKISTGCGETARIPVLATINPAPTGGTVSSNQTSCIYGTPDDLHLSGNTGTILKWQKSTNSNFASPTDLANTTSTLSGTQMGALTQTTYYRAIAENTGCYSFSGTATVTVNPYPNDVSHADFSSTPCNVVSPDNWVMLVAPDNTIIACVHDAIGGNDLGSISATVHLENTTLVYNSLPYMQRVVTITPASNGPAKVRLFFTQDELNNLKNADPSLLSVNQLGVTKFPGTSVSGTGEYITPTTISTAIETGMPNVYSLDIPVNGFSTFIIHNGSQNFPLPIGLADFEVKNSTNRSAEISWSTYSESNNDYFIVEHSRDGKKFTVVDKVKGAGNSNTLLKYITHDANPETGVNYYRLKQVDFDGKFTYSGIRSLYFNGNPNGIRLFPNPAQHGATLLVEVEERSEISIQVSTMNGKIIEQINTVQESGVNSFLIGNGLIAGIYHISVKHGEMPEQVLKLVVL